MRRRPRRGLDDGIQPTRRQDSIVADGRIEFTGESIESALIDTLDPAGSRWIPLDPGKDRMGFDDDDDDDG